MIYLFSYQDFADTGKPWEDMVGETESVTSSDSGISEFEIHRESFGKCIIPH